MNQNILELIASNSYDESALDMLPHHSDYVLLFADACRTAVKILGRSQDRDSRARVGSLLKAEGRKKSLAIDARRFTTAIPLGVLTSEELELHTRVTVTEHFGRQGPQKPFRPIDYGAIALKLFVFAPDTQELEVHRAVCQKTDDAFIGRINDMPCTPTQGIEHVSELLTLTHAALDFKQ